MKARLGVWPGHVPSDASRIHSRLCCSQHCLINYLAWKGSIEACTPKWKLSVHIKIMRKLTSRTKREWKKVKLRQDGIFLCSLKQRFLEHSESNNHVITWAFLTHIYSVLPSDLLACFPKQPFLTYGLHCLLGQGRWRKHFYVTDGGFWVISKAWPKPLAFFVIYPKVPNHQKLTS